MLVERRSSSSFSPLLLLIIFFLILVLLFLLPCPPQGVYTTTSVLTLSSLAPKPGRPDRAPSGTSAR